MKIVSRSIFMLGISIVAVLGLIAPVNAQQESTGAGNGIKISPVRTDLTINPGESKSIMVTVQNVTSVDTKYTAIINDFVAGQNEEGQPALILDPDKFAPKHSLKRYISAVPDLVIPAGQSKDVKVVVTIPGDAAGGGYYGSVRFTPASGGPSDSNVTLSTSVGSLILVRVPGDVNENVTLQSFDARNGEKSDKAQGFFVSNANIYAVARFQNNGNVHAQPFGKVVLKKNGKVIQTAEINDADPRGNVLPDSTRRFNAKLDKVGLWGKYTVEGNFGYGTNGQLISGKTSFWIVPLPLIIGVILVAGILIGMAFGLPRMIKRYNEKVIRSARRR